MWRTHYFRMNSGKMAPTLSPAPAGDEWIYFGRGEMGLLVHIFQWPAFDTHRVSSDSCLQPPSVPFPSLCTIVSITTASLCYDIQQICMADTDIFFSLKNIELN